MHRGRRRSEKIPERACPSVSAWTARMEAVHRLTPAHRLSTRRGSAGSPPKSARGDVPTNSPSPDRQSVVVEQPAPWLPPKQGAYPDQDDPSRPIVISQHHCDHIRQARPAGVVTMRATTHQRVPRLPQPSAPIGGCEPDNRVTKPLGSRPRVVPGQVGPRPPTHRRTGSVCDRYGMERSGSTSGRHGPCLGR